MKIWFVYFIGAFLYLHSFILNAQSPILLDLKKTECESAGWGRTVLKRILYKNYHGDTLELKIAVITNCGGISEIDLKNNQDTLMIYYFNGIVTNSITVQKIYELTACNCYHIFSFKIAGVQKNPSTVYFGDDIIFYNESKYKIYPIKYELHNGDTINYVDEYGLAQGRWIKPGGYQIFYVDGQWLGTYYETGILKERYFLGAGGYERYVTYHENGKIKSDCKIEPGEDWLDKNFKNCQYWDEKGEKK